MEMLWLKLRPEWLFKGQKFLTDWFPNFLWPFDVSAKQPMEKDKDSEQLINKLIKKRKQENDAFIKLLSAIETKTEIEKKPKTQQKSKA